MATLGQEASFFELMAICLFLPIPFWISPFSTVSREKNVRISLLICLGLIRALTDHALSVQRQAAQGGCSTGVWGAIAGGLSPHEEEG